MTNKRKDIAKLIEELRGNKSLVDNLQAPVFESVVAELFAQNQAIVEVQRNFDEQVDFFGRFRDELNNINTVGIEVKNLANIIDTSAVERFGRSIASLGIDKGYLVCNTELTGSAKSLASQYQDTLQLIDRSKLSSMIDQYTINYDMFATSLFDKVRDIELDELAHILNPTPEQIEKINPEAYELKEEEKGAIVSVNGLPFRVIANIMRSPHEVRNLTPRQFEEFVAETLAQLGFSDVILTPRSRDGGKDVIASNEINGIPISFYFECKQYAEGNKIQLETLRALLGTLAHDAREVNKGVLVTTSTFTRGSEQFVFSEARLDGKDYQGILGWINELNKEM